MRRAGERAVVAVVGFLTGFAVLAALPDPGRGAGLADVLRGVDEAVEAVAPAVELRAREEEERRRRERERALAAAGSDRATDPLRPPLHGTNPHGQGTVAVVDLTPGDDAPTGGDPSGSDSGEDVVVGRARGEQREDGTYHGHITIVSLFGTEILGVDTNPGESAAGPLDPVQTGILDALCDGSGDQICLEVLKADSSTDENGSTNSFGVASATVGGPGGIQAGAAQSNGNISDDGRCQTAHGDSSVANANVGGNAVASVSSSSTDSRACRDEAPTQTNASSVIGLGGQGVPLPAAGCADGTPDTATGLPPLAPIYCNADDQSSGQAAAPYGTRDALDVYALDAGGSQLLKTSTAASESRAQAPRAPQCSDGADNDGDGVSDAADPGCLSGPGGSYNPNDDDETDPPECSDARDNDGDGLSDASDPGCLSGPGGTYDPNDDDERDARTPRGTGNGDGGGDGGDGGDGTGTETSGDLPACSDGADNDGDGLTDRDDPGCRDGSGRYDPNDPDESDRTIVSGSLPRTGADALLVLIAGVLMLGGGAGLRRARP